MELSINSYLTNEQKMEALARAMDSLSRDLSEKGYPGDTIALWVASAFKGVVE